jgi:RES domain-containing protein
VLPDSELREILLKSPLIPVHGPWVRVVQERYLRQENPDPLWAGGPVKFGARFTPKGSFESLYLASDPFTALYEVEAVFRPFSPRISPPLTLLTIEGLVENVLDLTDSSLQTRLGTSHEELAGNWKEVQHKYLSGEGPLPVTQRLGKRSYESSRISGLLYCSAKNPEKAANLVVFPDRLGLGESTCLEVYDPTGILRKRLP